ncbi:MAG: peptidoglycan DD-metalloendopeptidase family protein [Acidobacteria bacterium]|nr:peptidoglycan DD-metalloendopeptidase family protein [Acidobacteriota bacterium]
MSRILRATVTPWLAALLAVQAAVAGQTPDPAQTDAQARRVNERIRALETEADRLASQSRTVLGELRALEIEQQLEVERVGRAREAVAHGEAAVGAATAQFEALDRQRLTQLPDLKVQLVDVYKRGRGGYARLLFGGSTMRDFSRAARAVAALMRMNELRLAEHRRTLDQMRRQRATLEDDLRALEAREAEARQARAAADRAVAARSALIAQIDARRDVNAQFAGELQLAYERLQQQVANLAAGRTPEPIAVPLAPFRGALDWPAPGRVAVRFGQSSGRLGETAVRNGIEIAAAADTPVRAVHPGTVSYADAFTGFGNLVIVDHGGNTFSLYGYLDAVSVRTGDAVDAGTELGRVGSAPAGPPALYFEVRIDGRSVDPIQWLKPR